MRAAGWSWATVRRKEVGHGDPGCRPPHIMLSGRFDPRWRRPKPAAARGAVRAIFQYAFAPADRPAVRCCAIAGKRGRTRSRLRGRNFLHGCGGSARKRSTANRSGSGSRVRAPVAGSGFQFPCSERAIARGAIEQFIERGVELQHAAAARSSQVRTMDDHFLDLFARYQALGDTLARTEISSAAA